MSPFIETRSGARFMPLDPVVADIHVEDIAHALSHQCRFSGHTRAHYSVAEHSVRVSWLLRDWGCDVETQLWGLLHDASEAYLVDVPQPLKVDPRFAFYKVAEANMMRAICERFDLPEGEPFDVRVADGVLLATEARDLMPYRPAHWTKLRHQPLADTITPWTHEQSRRNFMARYKELVTE